jgi:hypothetical protein
MNRHTLLTATTRAMICGIAASVIVLGSPPVAADEPPQATPDQQQMDGIRADMAQALREEEDKIPLDELDHQLHLLQVEREQKASEHADPALLEEIDRQIYMTQEIRGQVARDH